MKVPNVSPAGSQGSSSSSLLAILAVTSFVLVFALMFRSSRRSERETGAQENAVSSTFSVFNAYESAMDGPESPTGREKAKDPKSGAGLPMHLINFPKEEEEEASGDEAQSTSPENKSPSASVSPVKPGEFNEPEEAMHFRPEVDDEAGEWDRIEPAGREEPDALAASESKTSDSVALRARNGLDRVSVEHILPDAGHPPAEGAPVFVRGKSGAALPAELLAGLTGAPQEKRGMVFVRGTGEMPTVESIQRFEPVNRLSAPLFSLSEGIFPMSEFNLRLKLADANANSNSAAEPVSRILYSIGSGAWISYDQGGILVPPGATVTAYCESIDRDWADSEKVTREYLAEARKLEAPRMTASSPRFDTLLNRRILISITNPNELSRSRLEYRVDGGLWHPYAAPFSLEADEYSEVGARVETRALPSATVGVSVVEESDAVAIVVAPAGPALIAAAGNSVPVDPGSVDLGAPVFQHGYSEQFLGQWSDSEGIATFPDLAPAIPVSEYDQPLEVVNTSSNRASSIFESGDGESAVISLWAVKPH